MAGNGGQRGELVLFPEPCQEVFLRSCPKKFLELERGREASRAGSCRGLCLQWHILRAGPHVLVLSYQACVGFYTRSLCCCCSFWQCESNGK